MNTLANETEVGVTGQTDQGGLTRQARWAAYVELTKLRISIMVLVTFVVTAVLAAHSAGSAIDPVALLCAVVGMFLVAASGNAMNMYLERYSDFLMPRTAERPLPAQKLSANEVATFVSVALSVGLTILLTMVNWQTAACGLGTWVLYSLVYTPWKRRHWSNTEVGAVAGALPILMGSLATTGRVGLIGWAFFGVLFFWQFPHFMAIAWKYREDYRRGGLKMLTVTDPTGRAAGRKSVVTALMLILVSLVPVLGVRTPFHAGLLVLATIGLGWFYLKASWDFSRDRSDTSAMRLLLVSLLYLPLYMAVLVVAWLT